VFTSGGTESINHAIKGAFFGLDVARRENGHIITSAIEHVAVKETLEFLQKQFGVQVTTVPVDKYGQVSAELMMWRVQLIKIRF